jgi:dihydrofolate reductase
LSGIDMVIVVAAATNRVIGRDNDLPWRIPSDLKHFKAVTLGRPMIMGRRTFQSIGRPLPGRTTIVVSRDPGFCADGVTVVSSLEAGFAEGRRVAARDGVGEMMVVGGGDIYAQTLPLADRVEITEVKLSPESAGAVLFPALDPAIWVEAGRIAGERGPRDDADFDFVTWRRR